MVRRYGSGLDLTYPPFEMLDPTGRPDGVGGADGGGVGQASGPTAEDRADGVFRTDPSAPDGEYRLGALIHDRHRRAAQVDRFLRALCLHRTGDLGGEELRIQSIEDLKLPGRTIAAKTATTGETWAIEHLPQAKRVVFEDQTACVLEVAQGRADAFGYDQLSIYSYARANPDTTRGLLKPFVEESWALAIAKGNDALRAEVNEFITAFRERRGFEELGERYLREEKRFLEEQGIPFILR